MALKAPHTQAGETRDYWVLAHWNIQRRQVNTKVNVDRKPVTVMRDVEIYVDEEIDGKAEKVKKTVKRPHDTFEVIEHITRKECDVETAVWHCWPSAEAYAADRADGETTGRSPSVASHWCTQTSRPLLDGATASGSTDDAYTNHKSLFAAVLGVPVLDV